MVDLGGYVIILVETNDKRVKLYGSPADKADLEVKHEVSRKRLTLEWDNLFTLNKMKTKQQVADEILEINGKPLHNSSHTEVINHIHNVRKRRCILKAIMFCKTHRHHHHPHHHHRRHHNHHHNPHHHCVRSASSRGRSASV